MGNQEWAIQRHWQHWIPITQDEDKQNTQKTKQHKKLKRSATRTHHKPGVNIAAREG